MDPKQKMIFGVVAGLCGAVIIALAAWLFNQIGAMNEAHEARDSAESQIRSYYDETPYPSKANCDIRKKDEATSTEVADAARKLLELNLEFPKDETPSQFVTRVANTIHELDARKNAKRVEIFDGAAKNKKAAAATAEPEMDYAFGRYVQKGELPKDTDVPRLAYQFAVIEHVCDILLDAGALTITQVTREMFDDAKNTEAEETNKRNARRSSRRSAKDEKKTETTGVQLPDELAKDGVTAEAFSVSFRANYATIAKVMNALAEDKLFVVVTDLSFKNPMDLRMRVAEIVKRRESAVAAAARRSRSKKDEEQAAEPEKEVALFETAKPAERLVSDPENAMPMEVSLKFEVYSVPPAETPAEEAAPAEAAAETAE